MSVENHTDRDDLIHRLADVIRSRGLAAPAILFLEFYRPLSYVGGQAMLLAQPVLDFFVDGASIERLVDLMEDGDAIKRLTLCLEAGPEKEVSYSREGIR